MNLSHLPDQPAIYLVLAAFLLTTGIFGLIRRRTLIGMLISGELIFAAAGLYAPRVRRRLAGEDSRRCFRNSICCRAADRR